MAPLNGACACEQAAVLPMQSRLAAGCRASAALCAGMRTVCALSLDLYCRPLPPCRPFGTLPLRWPTCLMACLQCACHVLWVCNGSWKARCTAGWQMGRKCKQMGIIAACACCSFRSGNRKGARGVRSHCAFTAQTRHFPLALQPGRHVPKGVLPIQERLSGTEGLLQRWESAADPRTLQAW